MRAKKLFQVNCLLSLLVMVVACGLANVRTQVDSFTVGDSPRLEADVDISRLQVRSTDAGQVRVETTLRHARQTEYQVSQTGDTIQLSVRMAQGFSNRSPAPPVEITISVPPNADLDLRSSSGYLYVNGVSGDITMTSSAGGLQVSDSAGSLELRTQTGPVECQRAQGDFVVQSNIGRVDLTDVIGTFDVATDTGSIYFAGQLTAARPQRFASNSGSIDLQLRDSPGLSVDASSQTGAVRCTVKMTAATSTRNMCKGVVGADVAIGELQVRTSTGAITIR